MSSRGTCRPVADRNGELRKQLEKIQAEQDDPDVSLADIVRRLLREGIARRKEAAS